MFPHCQYATCSPPCHGQAFLLEFAMAAAVPRPNNALAKQKAPLCSSSCLRVCSTIHIHWYCGPGTDLDIEPFKTMPRFKSWMLTRPSNHHHEWDARLENWMINWQIDVANLHCEEIAPAMAAMVKEKRGTNIWVKWKIKASWGWQTSRLNTLEEEL